MAPGGPVIAHIGHIGRLWGKFRRLFESSSFSFSGTLFSRPIALTATNRACGGELLQGPSAEHKGSKPQGQGQMWKAVGEEMGRNSIALSRRKTQEAQQNLDNTSDQAKANPGTLANPKSPSKL